MLQLKIQTFGKHKLNLSRDFILQRNETMKYERRSVDLRKIKLRFPFTESSEITIHTVSAAVYISLNLRKEYRLHLKK